VLVAPASSQSSRLQEEVASYKQKVCRCGWVGWVFVDLGAKRPSSWLPWHTTTTGNNATRLQVTAIVEEYFSSGDVGNAADSLAELDAPPASLGHYFVKRLVTRALDRKDKEREMASSLLSSLYAEVGVDVRCV
jgi:hypothetical protein